MKYPLSICPFFKAKWCLVPVLILIFGVLQGQKRIPYETKNYTVIDGLPDNTIYGCLQDSKKYMWFFTPAGASRFDGRRFENFTIADNLADNEILNAFEDSKGRIWFRTANGKLSYFNTSTNKIISFRNDSLLQKAGMKSIIIAINEKKNGNIMVYYNNFNSEISDKSLNVRHDVFGFNVLHSKHKKIFIIGEDITEFDDSLNVFREIMSVKSFRYPTFLHDSTFFICIKTGIYTFKIGDKHKKLLLPASAYDNKYVQYITVDDDHNLWVGAFDGAYRFNIQNLTDNNFFYTGAYVTSVVKDHEQNYWISTLGKGVMFLPFSFKYVHTFNKNNGLTEDEMTCLRYYKPQDKLILSTKPNTIYALKNGFIQSKTVLDTSDQLKINKLEFIGNDLWFIVQNEATSHISNYFQKPPSTYKIDIGAPILSFKNYKVVSSRFMHQNVRVIKNIYHAKDKIYTYLLNWNLLKFRQIDDNQYFISIKHVNEHGRIYGITESDKGIIWFGGMEGIGYYNPQLDTIVKLEHLNFESTINDLIAIDEQTIIVSTAGTGVYLIKNGKIISNWREENGLSSNTCTRLIKENEKSIWVGTAKGVSNITFTDNTYEKANVLILGGKNNNPATYINDLVFYKDSLVLATNAGLYFINVKKMTPQYSVPILKVISPDYYLQNLNTNYSLEYSLFKNTNHINFQFQTISYLNGEDILYTYELFLNDKQLQKDSLFSKDKFILPLTSLTDGQYKLSLTAKRTDGVVSTPVVLYFTVGKPLYLSNFAILIYLLISAWGGYRLRQYINRKNHERREQAIKQKEENVRLEQKAIETNKQKMALEQASLRASIDPHFIFNCLNNMLSFVYEKDFQNLKFFLPQLARLVRNSLQLGNEDFISIETEKNYLTDYLQLEKMRFENKFDFKVDIDTNIDMTRKVIPPLMLQIFVENAIKHGFKQLRHNEKGLLTVQFSRVSDSLHCIITDNGVGIAQTVAKEKIAGEHKSMGMEIVRKRIHILNELYNLNISLTVESSENQTGTQVVLQIPF